MNELAQITDEENEVMNLLGEAWNKFTALPVLHGSDKADFQYAIHLAQNIILARVGMRSLNITNRIETANHQP